MAKRKAAGNKKTKQAGNGENGGIVSLTKELFQAAITLRGSVEPADYKRYVLPIIVLRFLSLRYDRRRAEIQALVADKDTATILATMPLSTTRTNTVALGPSSSPKPRGGRTSVRPHRPTISR